MTRAQELSEDESRYVKSNLAGYKVPRDVVFVDELPRNATGKVQQESDAKAPIGLGEAVETGAGELPSRWIIHAATMHLGGPTDADIIRRATAATLQLADELEARSLALVAFGTGVGGFPLDEAARIEVEEVRRHLEGDSRLERVVFAVHGEQARAAFAAALAS